MVKTSENGSPVAPFLLKCYEMVNDESTDELISWSQTCTNSFIIRDVSRFSSELLPKYFKHSNFSSFIRQLNIYGFRKTDTDRWEFSNDEFVKYQRHLLKNINRRKHTPAQVQRKSSQQKDTDTCASEEDKRTALTQEIEILKIDRNALMQELMKLRQHQQISESKLILLREQLKGMEKNQQQMLSFIVMAMQNPGFLVQLLHPKENNWRAAETDNHKITPVVDNCGSVSSDGAIVRYQLPANEGLEPSCIPAGSDSENHMEFNISDEIRDLLMNIDSTPGSLDEKMLSQENNGPHVLPDSLPGPLDEKMLSLENKDSLVLPDSLPAPLDEKMLFLENNCPLVLPDSPDGVFLLDQLLLSCPLSGSKESDELDREVCLDPGMVIESAFPEQESNKFDSLKEDLDQNNRIRTTGVDKGLDNPESLDHLTAQMGSLNS